MADMTPERAREVQLRILKHGVGFDDIEEMRRSLDTLAAMRVEHDHGPVDWETPMTDHTTQPADDEGYLAIGTQHRYAVARDNNNTIIISDNDARVTIRIPHEHISDMIIALIAAKKDNTDD